MSSKTPLRLAAAALVALAAAAPAVAGGFADLVPTPVVTPVPVAPPPGGEWGGGFIGAEISGSQLRFEDGAFEAEGEGSLAGLHTGYRFDFGRFVAGGEIAYGVGEVEGIHTDVTRAGVQVGYDAGRVLPYLAAGYANVSLGDDIGDFGDFDGGYVGIGADYAATSRLTVGAQYLVHSFDDTPVDGIDADLDTLGLRAAYSF